MAEPRKKSANPGRIDLAMDGDRGEDYVYLLTKNPAVGTSLNLDDVFYVGKGRGLRWAQHFAEARKAIARGDGRLSAKHLAIREILANTDSDDLNFEDYAYIVKGGLDEQSALTLEALTIELLRKAGVDLTNIVAGHHSSAMLKPAAEVRRYYSAEPFIVEEISAGEKSRPSSLADFRPGGTRSGESVVVVVKGSTETMARYEDVRTGEEGRFAGSLRAEKRNRVEGGRRGWNPDDPWTDEEARDRAEHYWPVSPKTAGTLRSIARDGRLSWRSWSTTPVQASRRCATSGESTRTETGSTSIPGSASPSARRPTRTTTPGSAAH
ncbi:MAG: GIY-YIG nuclease family protein [Gordonia sp. (in: high G+C Gram-positive bacteria)]|uniref:LEM-3-like GIY-YIG domain-containing protein n=1 Tax=Gordonia sp. (in: high G+C Gram-positive bacteria) TaxID=84139 RepID=UPI0039E3538A